MNIIIKVESEEHKQKILEVLENAEMDGQLDFSFSVQTKRGEWMNKLFELMDLFFILWIFLILARLCMKF